jgi:8-hydroxy-5-deazaflavin:NADPH oxidoreductase
MSDARSIAILGGTAGIGHGLALRLCAAGESVVIGSRVAERADDAAGRVRALVPGARVTGRTNPEAAAAASAAVLSIPFEGVAALLPMLQSTLRDRLLIETVVPLRVHHDFAELLPIPGGSSVGEWLHAALSGVRVVSAWKNLAAAALRDLARPVVGDVLICGEDPGARADAARLVGRVPALRAIDVGTIRNARYLEAITPLVVGLNRRFGITASIAITGFETSDPGPVTS